MTADQRRTQPTPGNRILVVLPSWVGDCMMATPFLRELRKENQPDAQLIGYMRPGLDQLFEGSNLLDEVIVGQPRGLRGPWREARRIHQANGAAAYLLPNSFRLALTTWLARIPQRIGYRREARGPLLTQARSCPVPGGWNEPISAVDYYLALLGHSPEAQIDRRIAIGASSEQHAQARAVLAVCGIEDTDPFVLLNPGANRIDKRWPADRFAELGLHLRRTTGWPVLVNGSPAETPLLDEIVERSDGAIRSLGDHGINLGSLKAICARATLIITNDTGTRHIAIAAMNDALMQQGDRSRKGSVLTLFGPTDPRWADVRCEFETIIATGGSPIDGITLQAVLDAAQAQLQRSNAPHVP